MGAEKEKADTSIVMDEGEFDRSIGAVLARKEDGFSSASEDRDPDDVNAHLRVGFDDVIAEPPSARTFDRVWICSHASFEVVKFGLYRLLGTLLAVPLAFLLGLVFAVLSLVHIWLVTPGIRTFLVALPSLRVVWTSLTDTLAAPFFRSLGAGFSSVRVQHDDQ
ncbi:caveolin-2 [Syngnathoides biaculeatus]|uniref:caveolin-2 n=1 Tax=Syngnathoides biaculeatus TaxID=300417 RepID=UPI002ADE6B97|nr:caveolin-2 [Syngnathoides biaculeatus]